MEEELTGMEAVYTIQNEAAEQREMTMRDHLAYTRTKLAMLRTFLSIIRTSLGLLATGACLIILQENPFLVSIGYVLLLVAAVVMLFGSIDYYRYQKTMTQILSS